jgi:nitroreductase/SAM-dependent methyltransferase
MELNEVLNKRRSYRKFLSKAVDRETAKELIRSAIMAPDACNLQLTRYVFIDDKNVIEKLKKAVGNKFSFAPCYIVVVRDPRFEAERSAGVMSAGMALENIFLKAADLGLGTCAMSGFGNDMAIREILSIPGHLEILLLVAVGYPDLSVEKEPIPKLGVEEILSFNDCGGSKCLNASADLDDNSVNDVINYRRRIAPVYLDRFKLNTFDLSYYEKVFDIFSEKVLLKIKNGRLLDLMSYDGIFLKLLDDKKTAGGPEIIASDYLSANLSFFNKKFGIGTSLIDASNKLSGIGDDSLDAVSFIFQAEFTPKLDCLLGEIYAKLKPGGYFFAATVGDIWYKKAAKWLVSRCRSLFLGERANVYKNNPFFKLGPIGNAAGAKLASRIKKAGFGSVEVYKIFCGRKGAIIRVYSAKK